MIVMVFLGLCSFLRSFIFVLMNVEYDILFIFLDIYVIFR